MRRRSFLLSTACAGLPGIPALTSNAWAQSYPTKPIKLVVPFAPGGNADITARVIAPALSQALGQPVVVDNKAGAGGMLGAGQVAKADPDGYTILLGSSGAITNSPAVHPSAGYDPIKDFVAIGMVQTVPMLLVASGKGPLKSYAGLLEAAKRRPGGITAGTAGTGSSGHLALEYFKASAGVFITHIPYRGSGPALNALVAGQIDLMMDQISSSLPFVRDNQVVPIAVTSASRSPLLPAVPTLAELGLKNFEATTFAGVFAPASTPAAVVAQLRTALAAATASAAVKDRLVALGTEPAAMTSADFDRYVRADLAKWRNIVRTSNIKVD